MAFTHTVAHRAATVNTPATRSKNEFATSVTVGLRPLRQPVRRSARRRRGRGRCHPRATPRSRFSTPRLHGRRPRRRPPRQQNTLVVWIHHHRRRPQPRRPHSQRPTIRSIHQCLPQTASPLDRPSSTLAHDADLISLNRTRRAGKYRMRAKSIRRVTPIRRLRRKPVIPLRSARSAQDCSAPAPMSNLVSAGPPRVR